MRRPRRLRQPHERPPSRQIAADTPPSWWVGLDRQALAIEAEARANAMRATKEYTYIPFRMLQ